MTKIEFSINRSGSCLDGTLVYVPSDYAFDFRAGAKPSEHSSVQINSLQLAVDYDGAVLYAHGFCPLLRHRESSLLPPASSHDATLHAIREQEWIPGIAYTIGGPTDWPIWINKRAGWVCIGAPEHSRRIEAVEFATGSIAVLDGTRLVSVWLHPEGLPKLPPGEA